MDDPWENLTIAGSHLYLLLLAPISSKLPLDVSRWTCTDVANWMHSLCPRLPLSTKQAIDTAGIDGNDLLLVTVQQLTCYGKLPGLSARRFIDEIDDIYHRTFELALFKMETKLFF
jgi:hypothetical protein